MGRRIFITAAEVSGDLHASHLVRALRELDPSLVIEGHGGARMREAGCLIHYETTAKAAMGLGAIGRVREMFRLLKQTRARFAADPPDLQICVDSPALNFHFAKAAKTAPARPIPVLYYVAPQLWAWREGRMKKLRRWVDKVACILPFEQEYFRGHGVDATFVGHPLFDEMNAPGEAKGLDIAPRHAEQPPAGGAGALTAPTIGLLAGSRRSEAAANFPRMLEVARAIKSAFPSTKFLLPTTAATNPVVTELLQSHSPAGAMAAGAADDYTVEQDAFDRFVPLCELVITVSGTATLHVAIHNTPMIVVYHGSAVLWNAIGRWLIRTRTYGLVNLLAADPLLAASGRVTREMHVVPEFIPWYGSTTPVSEYAIDLLKNPEKLASQRADLRALVQRLNHPGASLRTAKMALAMLDGKNGTAH